MDLLRRLLGNNVLDGGTDSDILLAATATTDYEGDDFLDGGNGSSTPPFTR